MTKKYIVKNCPSITGDECNSYRDEVLFCQDCPDCLLKRIIKGCKETINTMKNDSSTNAYAGGRYVEAENVLKMFVIEECE